MKRFHALEWEDLQWFPKEWRDYGTDYLGFIATKFDIYKPIVPLLKKGIEAGNGKDWIDLASGGGSGLTKLTNHLKTDFPELKVTLTDYYPNIKAFERTKQFDSNTFEFETKSVNAMHLPSALHGKFRTVFAGFHHFRPNDARKVLQDALDTNSPIAIFEPVGRNAPSFISMLFVILNVLILTPFIRPVRLSVLPFIYLIPIIPLYILWDGLASIFRTYSENELKELVADLKNTDQFEWEIGKKQHGPSPIYYLLGVPRKG